MRSRYHVTVEDGGQGENGHELMLTRGESEDGAETERWARWGFNNEAQAGCKALDWEEQRRLEMQAKFQMRS